MLGDSFHTDTQRFNVIIKEILSPKTSVCCSDEQAPILCPPP